MIDRREFHVFPSEPDRSVWCRWLRHHTIDPADVVAVDDGFIEIDIDACQIRYLEYNRNEQNRRFVAPCGTKVSMSVRVVQLETKPSPFPV